MSCEVGNALNPTSYGKRKVDERKQKENEVRKTPEFNFAADEEIVPSL